MEVTKCDAFKAASLIKDPRRNGGRRAQKGALLLLDTIELLLRRIHDSQTTHTY